MLCRVAISSSRRYSPRNPAIRVVEVISSISQMRRLGTALCKNLCVRAPDIVCLQLLGRNRFPGLKLSPTKPGNHVTARLLDLDYFQSGTAGQARESGIRGYDHRTASFGHEFRAREKTLAQHPRALAHLVFPGIHFAAPRVQHAEHLALRLSHSRHRLEQRD